MLEEVLGSCFCDACLIGLRFSRGSKKVWSMGLLSRMEGKVSHGYGKGSVSGSLTC